MKDKQITGESGGGFVKVTLDGQYNIKKIEYEENDIIMKDVKTFTDLIIFAHNNALEKMNDITYKLLLENGKVKL